MVFISFFVILKLILKVLDQSGDLTVFLIGAVPGKMVLTHVVLNCETRCIWFN